MFGSHVSLVCFFFLMKSAGQLFCRMDHILDLSACFLMEAGREERTEINQMWQN